MTLLGLEPHGHTASLFLGSAALTERDRWTTVVAGAKSETRNTLTYPVLESRRRVAFLVMGEEKCTILARLGLGYDTLPAAPLHPAGTMWLFADAAAGTAIA